MAIVINLDVMMAKRKMGLTELSKEVDVTMANLSILKNNKAKAIRFTTIPGISQYPVYLLQSSLHSACKRIYSDGLFYFMQLQQL